MIARNGPPRPIIGDFPDATIVPFEPCRSVLRAVLASDDPETGHFLFFFPHFLWAHRSGNSSPLRPTRLLLSWDLPQIIRHPPRVQALACDSTPPRGWADRVYAHGIKIEWIVDCAYAPGTPWPHAPEGFKGMWGEPPLSKADPDSFRAYFEPLLAKLEANGMILAGFELSNEINWAGFNADFPLPGQDKNDLVHDPEGQQIAKGLLQYVKTLTVLKDIRDHSKLNQRTPIISAGLADLDGSDWPHQRRADALSVFATLDFLRTNGLDKLVDGYGIHSYPPSSEPGT